MLSAFVLSAEKKLGAYAIRCAGAIVALLVVLCFSAPTALGQCTTLAGTVATWSAGTSSNWYTGSNWSTSAVPNSSSTSACIVDGSSTVTLDANTGTTIDDLQLASGNTLTTGLNTQLVVAGTQILNAGSIVINGGSGTNSGLYIENNVTLSGGGTLTLSTAGGGGNANIGQSGAGFTLTNQSTIEGNGVIGNTGLSLMVNSGTVDANVSGQGLLLEGNAITNTNLLEATGGGVLQLNGVTVNNAGGNITANGGTVQLYGGTDIQGGTLNTLNGGTLGTPQGYEAYLDGSTSAVTIKGTYTAALNSTTYLLGTITNLGNIQVNGGSGSNTGLSVDSANVTLNGGGTVTLSTASGGGNAIIYQAVGGETLTNADNTIQGSGIIGDNGLSFGNSGTVNANVSGQGLYLESITGAIPNTGLLEATGGGVLELNGVTVNNGGANITANGGTVQLYDGTVIVGGTLTNKGGGWLGTPQGYAATLDGSTAGAITLKGTYTSDVNSSTTLLGTINNNNLIQVNGGSGSNTSLIMGEGAGGDMGVTLQGGGTVTLSTATGGGNAIIDQAVGGMTLTNVNNTIQGEGIIGDNGLTVINESGGTIDANSKGVGVITTLTLESMGGGLTNQGLLEATNDGALLINGVTVSNGGANITATGSGASVQLYDGTDIVGGNLNNNGGAFFGTPSGYSATLDGSTAAGAITLNGTYTSDLNTSTTLLGTINNNNIQVNGGGGSNTGLIMGEGAGGNKAVTLQGGGTVTLSTATGGGNAYIYQSVGGMTLTNVNNTIQGEGIIGDNGLSLVNEATIDANSTGNGVITTLTLESMAGLTNQGLLEATNNGALLINGVTVSNAGANITANGPGASVQLYGGTTIQGGTLNNNGGWLGTVSGYNAYLDGSTAGAITLNGTYTSDLNTNTYLLGTINNKNNFQVNGGAGDNTELIMGSNVTLQGGGTLTLNTAGGGGQVYVYQAAGGTTLENVNNLIQGNGEIGYNGLTLLNDAAGVVNANVSGGTLLLAGSPVTNAGLLEATGGGTLEIESETVNNAAGSGGNITANGGAVAIYDATIEGGTLNTLNGGTMETLGGTYGVLDGTTEGALTISAGSTYTSALNTTTYLLGTFINHGNIQVNGGSGSNTYLIIDSSNVTLKGGGTLTLSTGGGGGTTTVYQAAGGTTLENVDNTIQGAGQIGYNGLSVLNDAAGTLLANAPGQTLLFYGGGTLTNNGTMEAAEGGTLEVSGMTLANYNAGTSTLTGGTYIVDGTTAASAMVLSVGSNTGGEIVNNAANIILNGANANVSFVDNSGNPLLSALAANTTAGSGLTIENGYNLATPGDFANAGTVTVGTVAGDTSTFTMNAGANAYNQSGGMTQGTGTIAGNVTINGGTIQPGLPSAPGTLNIAGSYTQNGGTFSEQIMGDNTKPYGVLNVTGGSVSLGTGVSNLNITLLGTSPVGNTYTILTDAGGTISGTFAGAPANTIFAMDGIDWTAAYNANSIVLDAVSMQHGLITANWTTGSGNWTDASEWSCSIGPPQCVPNNNSNNVFAAGLNSSGNTLTLDNTMGAITVNSLTLTAGNLNLGTGASLTVTGDSSNAGTIGMSGVGASFSTGTLNNSGTLTLGDSSDTVTVAGALNNTGNVAIYGPYDGVSGNELTAGSWSNLNGSGTLTGGGYYAIGGLFQYSAPTNGITSIGSGVVVALDEGGLITPDGTTDALAGLASNAGELQLTDHPETFTPAGSPGTFSNSGYLYLYNNTGSTTSLTVNGNFDNSGDTQLYGTSAQGLNVTGNSTNEGTISMTGTGDTFSTTGTLSNSGTISLSGTGDSLSAAGVTNTGSITLGGDSEILTDTVDFNNNQPGSLLLSGNNDTATVTGNFVNDPRTIGASVTLTGDSDSLTVGGTFTNDLLDTVTMSGSNGNITVTGALTNAGTISLTGSSPTGSNNSLTADSDLINTGSITVGGTGGNILTVGGDFNNNGGGASVLMNGTGGKVWVPSGTFNNNGGTVTIGGSSGSFFAGNFNNNGGTVTLSGSGDTLSTNAFSNSGSVTVGPNETLWASNTYTQTAGSTVVNGALSAVGDFSLTGGSVNVGNGGTLNVDLDGGSNGFTNNNGSVTIANGGSATVYSNYSYTQSGANASLDVNGTVNAISAIINGGTVSGSGTINAAVQNNGGNVNLDPSTLTVASFTQVSPGVLTIDIAGTGPGDYSVLAVIGNASLGGTVDFQAIDGFTPTAGEDFAFLTFGTWAGVFPTMEFSGLWSTCPTGDTCSDVVVGDTLTLEIASSVTPPPTVPEPSVFLLLAMGLAVMTILMKYRNTMRRGVE
jgi:hypothetical protein